MPTILIHGSHGELVVHAASGHIVERRRDCDCEDCAGVGYADVMWFDPSGFEPDAIASGHADILFTSPVYAGGRHEPAYASVWDGEFWIPDLLPRLTYQPG